MKSWLQLNGLWRLVSGQEKKLAARPEIKDSNGIVVSKAVALDEDRLEKWEIKAERAAGALKTGMSHDVKVLIRDCEDDPLLIWETLKTLFIQQWTGPRFNAYHALLSVEKSDSEPLDSLINKVDEQIRVIKSLSPSSLTLDQLYDEVAVMAIIRALLHSFDNVMHTISVLDKFDKPSVIQSLRNMDHINHPPFPLTTTMVSEEFMKIRKKAAAIVRHGDLSPEEKAEVLRQVATMLKLPCSVIDGAIFSDTLVPPDPETPDASDEAFADLADLVRPAILQAPLLTALRVLLPALATVAEYHRRWIMDPGFHTEHKLDYLFEATWEYLHPRRVSPAPYPVDIPPTPPSFAGDPDVPLVDSFSLPLTSAEIFGQPMAVDAADNGSSSEESHNRTPTPRPLEKGKMRAIDPVTPSPPPAPYEPPIELVSPAITSAVPQGTSAGVPSAPPGAAGKAGKTGKAKKGASFADVAAKAAKKPGGAEPPRQQSKITQHFQPAATTKPAKPPPSPCEAQRCAESHQSHIDFDTSVTCGFCGSARAC